MSTSTERMRALRARRAAGLVPVGGAPLRDADELLAPAVEETLRALQLDDRDAGVVALAREYAAAIDAAGNLAAALRVFGPLLLRVLEELRATPASRGAGKPQERPRPPNQLDRLRAAQMQRPAARRTPGA